MHTRWPLRSRIVGCAVLITSAALVIGLRVLPAQKAAPLYGAHGVSAGAVRQGYLGTSYFHAAIGALANSYPDTIRSAIRVDKSGNYRVKFFEGSEETINPDDVGLAETHNFDRSEGAWVGVLMRAYTQRVLRQSLYQAIERSDTVATVLKPAAHTTVEGSDVLLQAYDRAVRRVINQNGSIDAVALEKEFNEQGKLLGISEISTKIVARFLQDKPVFETMAAVIRQNGQLFGAYRSIEQAGIPSRVFQAFLGSAHTDSPAHRDRMLAHLRRIRQGGTAMVAESGTNQPANSAHWWIRSHSYTVLGFDEANRTVTLRNPWGEHPGPDGSFTITLNVFLQAFTLYSISGPDLT